MKRIGPAMERALIWLSWHPYPTQYEMSVAIGPNGSNGFGWRIVQRLVRYGLVTRNEGVGRNGQPCWRIELTDSGREWLAS